MTLFKHLCLRRSGLTALDLFLNSTQIVKDEDDNHYPTEKHFSWRWIKEFVVNPILEAAEFLLIRAKEEGKEVGIVSDGNQVFYQRLYMAFCHIGISQILECITNEGLNPKVVLNKEAPCNLLLQHYQSSDNIELFPVTTLDQNLPWKSLRFITPSMSKTNTI